MKLLNFLAKPHTWFQDVLKIDTFIRYIAKRELNLRFFLTYILIAGIIPSSLDNTSRWYMLQIWSHLGHVIRPFKYQPISSSKYPKKNLTMSITCKWQHLTEKCLRLPHDRPMSTNEFRLISATSESSILVSLFPLSSRSLKKDENVTSLSLQVDHKVV